MTSLGLCSARLDGEVCILDATHLVEGAPHLTAGGIQWDGEELRQGDESLTDYTLRWLQGRI
jgi:hypothetical protein